VRWQLEGSRPLTIETRGVATERHHSLASMFAAFRASLRNFLADPRVAQVLATEEANPRPKPVRPPPAAAPPARTSTDQSILRPAAADRALSVPELTARARSGVVTVLAGDGWASGIVLSRDGLILTQHTMIAGASSVTVVTHDGTEHRGTVVRVAREVDLVLLKVEARGLTPIPARLTPLPPRSPVTAIGTPFHPALSFSVSSGTASPITSSADDVTTTVRVSPGNGGGPILDERGRFAGVVIWPAGSSAAAGTAHCRAAAAAFRALGVTYGE